MGSTPMGGTRESNGFGGTDIGILLNRGFDTPSFVNEDQGESLYQSGNTQNKINWTTRLISTTLSDHDGIWRIKTLVLFDMEDTFITVPVIEVYINRDTLPSGAVCQKL